MQNIYIVIQKYENSNAAPIELILGDVVLLGEEFKDDEMWPNWINCVSIRTGKSGWTPIQILQIDGETGVATTDYTAKEMTVSVGDMLNGHNELNGWIWCVRESDGQSGWVPEKCLKQIKLQPRNSLD